MAQTIIDISTPNDGLGDPLRVAMDLQNGMNTELYNTKVDKVLGKELSSNDYTSAEKSKLSGIEEGAQVNVPADWNTLLNKPAELNNSVGYFYYDNTITALSFLAGVEKKLTNNKLGTETDVTHPPYGVTSLWDSTTNALDFTQLNVGDSVDLRLDSEITTTVNNQEIEVFLRVGIGSANPKDIVFNYSVAKTLGAQGAESFLVSFPIITEDVRDYPAELYVKSVDDGTILVGGFFIRAIRSGLNIVDVVVEDDAPSDGTLYGRKNATWEAVPLGGTLGLIKIVDKAGDFFTDLATAQAYVRTFKASGFTDESFSNGTFWFTVPNGSSFTLADEFLGGATAKSAYIVDELGLITAFNDLAFLRNSGNNILGNVTFNDAAFGLTTGNNILGNCTFNGGSSFSTSTGNNILGNCTFGDLCFQYSSGINRLGNILMIPTDSFAESSSGRFEIYGNIGTTEGANYTNFFLTSTAVIWAQKAKETSNAGGIEGDLATAQTNGAKLFFGYATSGSGGTPFSKEEFTYAGVQTFTLAATPAFIAAVFVNGQELNTTQFSTLTNVLTIVDTLETGDKVNILYNPASVGIAQYYTKTEIDNFNFEESHPNFVEVNSLANLPTPIGGVITLVAGYTYLFLNHLDLLGSRLVCGQDTVIVGWSSENCSITSTGLSAGTALITSVYSLPIRSISFTHGTVFDLNGDGTTTALDWFGVNILNSASAGTIKNYSNFIMESSALLNSGGFTFDGTFGTIGFGANCLFDTASGTTAINVLSTCTISRRLRVIYSSFVTLSGETGINFNASATVPDENYILDTVKFSGGGTYLTGVNDTSNKALFSNCVGITNTSTRGFMYMLNNATDTTIGAGNANVWIKAAGTTIAGTNSKYTHTTNRLTYTGAFVGSVLVTLNATVRSGSVNQNISIGVAKNGTVLPESEGIVRTSAANAEHGGSTQAVLEIASTDYIELFVRNTSVSDVRVTDFNFNVIKIPV